MNIFLEIEDKISDQRDPIEGENINRYWDFWWEMKRFKDYYPKKRGLNGFTIWLGKSARCLFSLLFCSQLLLQSLAQVSKRSIIINCQDRMQCKLIRTVSSLSFECLPVTWSWYAFKLVSVKLLYRFSFFINIPVYALLVIILTLWKDLFLI